MESDELRKTLLTAFEYCYQHDDWVNPLQEALEGISAETARRLSSPGATCIWQIVLHLAVWNENIVERILTGEPVSPAEGHWPKMPPEEDEAAWAKAKERLSDSLDLIATTIKTAPVEKLTGPPYGAEDILCRFIHMAYHLGQVTKMRETWDSKAEV